MKWIYQSFRQLQVCWNNYILILLNSEVLNKNESIISVATIVTTPIFYYLSNLFIPFSLSFANELSS